MVSVTKLLDLSLSKILVNRNVFYQRFVLKRIILRGNYIHVSQ